MACNFKGHEICSTIAGELMEKGFYVGRKVQLTRRISLKMTVDASGEIKYVDVAKGSIGSVIGVAKDTPVVQFNTIHKGVAYSADAAVKVGNLTLEVHEPESAASSSSGLAGGNTGSVAGKKQLKKGFEFLEQKEGELVEVSPDWSKLNATNHTDTRIKNLHSRLGMALAALIESVPVYNEKDLHVVTRSGKLEVWTARDFPAKTLLLAPETTEWKERLWCQGGKAVLVKYGTQ